MQIAHARKFIIALSLVSITPMVSAGVITEDFTGGVFDTNNFELGNAFGSGTGTAATGAYQGINRGSLRIVNDNLFGALADPLTLQADLIFTNWDIAFLSIRSMGLRDDDNKEPSDGLFYVYIMISVMVKLM